MSHSYHPKNSKDYITVGDPYEKKKAAANSRWKGTQFQTQPPKKGQTAGFFIPFSYQAAAYQDNTKYISTQPRDKRKLGFGSNDAHRRDEFTLDIRARQWKEKLSQEAIYTKTALQGGLQGTKVGTSRPGSSKPGSGKKMRPASAPVRTVAASEAMRRTAYRDQYKDKQHLFQTQVPFDLYEIGKTANTPICNKCSRETFYCPHRVGRGTFTARRPGTATTAYQTYGNFKGSTVTKPKYGNVNVTKQFYDQSHLSPGW